MFKVGDKVKTVSSMVSIYYKDQIGIIQKIDNDYSVTRFFVQFINIEEYVWCSERHLQLYYSTHDILQEILNEV